MDDNTQKDTNTQGQTAQTGIPNQVIQPPGPVEQNPQSMQPVQPTVVASQFDVPTEQNGGEQQPIVSTATPPLSDKDTIPVGMSASQLGLDEPRTHVHIGWRWFTKNGIYPIAMLLVVVGGLLFWKYYIDGMSTKTMSVGGYNYNFSFFRSATYGSFNGNVGGFRIGSDIAATITPQNDSYLPQYCTEVSGQWAQAFTVQVYGVSRPVCEVQSGQYRLYVLIFSALNHSQEFVVTCSQSQNAKVYPKLKSIFESVKVSKT